MLKHTLRRALSAPWLRPAWSHLVTQRLAIVTLHRFALPDLGVPGHDPRQLGRALQRLRSEGYELLALDAALARLRHGGGGAPALVFTVDDGYADFAEVGAEVFAAYDCPVTVFLATDFVGGACWLWWDQIAYVLAHSERRELQATLASEPLRLALESEPQRQRLAGEVSVRCTRVDDVERRRFIAALAAAAEVELPATPPRRYAPLGWAQARALEARGVAFGPHSTSHPILTRVSAEESARQIRESWEATRRELRRPLPVFSYPNGDFGPREVESVTACGLAAAVTTRPVYASAAAYRAPSGAYTVPRFPYPEEPEALCLLASGFSRLSDGLRRRLRPRTSPGG